MLLDDDVLTRGSAGDPEAEVPGEAQRRNRAADFWFAREEVEVLAASLFTSLAELFRDVGAPSAFVSMAAQSARDELEHADRCRAIVNRLSSKPRAPIARSRARVTLGPASLTQAQRALYTAVAVGCVTESLSTALLLSISQRATDALVAETAHAILKDEVRHSRLGWGYLANQAPREDVSFLLPFVPTMLESARAGEVQESSDISALRFPTGSLTAYGVLARDEAATVCRETITTVIEPGLAALLGANGNDIADDLGPR